MEDWKEITTDWIGEDAFIGHATNGVAVQMGSLGETQGLSPMQMLLIALSGCTAMDITSILRKKRQPLADFKVKVRARRAEDFPKIWTEIEVTYLLWGDLDPKAVEDAIRLSEEKYCSVGLMLEKAAHVHSAYQIFPPVLS